MRIWLLPLLAACLLPAPLPAKAQSPPPAHPSLQPGDVVKVVIWREEDLSGEFTVDETGSVTLPMLGARRVEGIPIPELRAALAQKYAVQLRNPAITITFLRRIYVLGEVNEPGVYAVDPTISLAGAVAMAGGANSNGDLLRIRILRQGGVELEEVRAESALSTVDVRSGDQIFVGRRSWFDRNSTFLISAMLSVSSILISLLR